LKEGAAGLRGTLVARDTKKKDEAAAAIEPAIEDAEIIEEIGADAKEPVLEEDMAPQTPKNGPASGAAGEATARSTRRSRALQTGVWVVITSVAISAAVGYSAARFALETADTAALDRIAEQAAEIEALRGQIAALPVAPTQGDIDAAVLTSSEAGAAALANLAVSFEDLLLRVDALEARPFSALPEGQFDDAMQAALAALQSDLDAQRTEIQGLAAAAAEELQFAQSAAAEVAAATAAAARETLAKSALAQIVAAIDTGVAFDGPLADLEEALGAPAPAGLAAAARDGVATLSELQSSFPDAARAALATARNAGEDGSAATNFIGFLRQQFEVRSVEPREGDDVDAILSRAEAALRQGDIGGALTELGGLPAVAAVEMADWRARAEARAAALVGAAELMGGEE
jgi:hypothetical protein